MKLLKNEFLVLIKNEFIKKMVIPHGDKLSFPPDINCIKDSIVFKEETIPIFRDERISKQDAAYVIVKAFSGLSIIEIHDDDEPDDCVCDECEAHERGFFS